MKHRYFQVGFNRCGTSSLAKAFENAGFKTVHHTAMREGEDVNIALAIERNLSRGRLPLDGFDDVEAFTDIEYVAEDRVLEGNKFFREIAQAHPEIKFVLNLRRKEDWIASRMGKDSYADRFANGLGVEKEALPEIWSAMWDSHIAAVRADLPPELLLILDIDAPDSAAMADFFGLDAPLRLPQYNKTAKGSLSKFAVKWSPVWLVRLVPTSIKNIIKEF